MSAMYGFPSHSPHARCRMSPAVAACMHITRCRKCFEKARKTIQKLNPASHLDLPEDGCMLHSGLAPDQFTGQVCRLTVRPDRLPDHLPDPVVVTGQPWRQFLDGYSEASHRRLSRHSLSQRSVSSWVPVATIGLPARSFSLEQRWQPGDDRIGLSCNMLYSTIQCRNGQVSAI
jgi:hypothetical protein